MKTGEFGNIPIRLYLTIGGKDYGLESTLFGPLFRKDRVPFEILNRLQDMMRKACHDVSEELLKDEIQRMENSTLPPITVDQARLIEKLRGISHDN